MGCRQTTTDNKENSTITNRQTFLIFVGSVLIYGPFRSRTFLSKCNKNSWNIVLLNNKQKLNKLGNARRGREYFICCVLFFHQIFLLTVFKTLVYSFGTIKRLAIHYVTHKILLLNKHAFDVARNINITLQIP